ncbi:MAG: Na(+)/H(+) antiporter subunit B [Proteobacteria bacterium]|nr:Na(+)/H(+) antiporter subunit B [Pseudomonadota bacterium]
MAEHVIIKTVSRLMIPFIQLFSLYVIAHGELGPGGGFQGGVILGASFILYAMVFGLEEGRKRISRKASDFFNPTGLFIYAVIGIFCILGGGRYLEYDRLPLIGNEILASQLGIYGIEIGVGITVSAVMTTLFFEMARREDD